MLYDQNLYNREILSYEEKIALAELEVAKAKERVQELKYEQARFQLDFFKSNSAASQSPQNAQ